MSRTLPPPSGPCCGRGPAGGERAPFTVAERSRVIASEIFTVIALCVLPGIAAAWLLSSAGAASPPQASPPPGGMAGPLVFTQVPADEAAAPGGRAPRRVPPSHRGGELPPGSRIVLLDPPDPSAGVRVLTPGFSAAGHPDLSWDARRILFVGRRAPSEPQGVWELPLDGGGEARAITERKSSSTEAIYLSSIYTIDAVRPVPHICFVSEGASGVPALFTCRLDGSRVRQITFFPHGAWSPLLLSDGRLLFSAGLPPAMTALSGENAEVDDNPGGGSALFTVNTDGTDVRAFAAVGETPMAREMACETAAGEVVYVESPPRGEAPGGGLVGVSRVHSLRAPAAIPAAAGTLHHSPAALPDGRLLVSRHLDGGGTFGISILEATGAAAPIPVHDSEHHHDVHAKLVAPRRSPPGRSSAVDDRWDHGFLYCLDASLSDRVPGGRLPREQVASVEVWRAIGRPPAAGRAMGDALPGASSESMATELLGVVPVEADGSFLLQVPARTPMRIRALDVHGKVSHAMRSWFWVMPRESRGCIGCHEDRELTPPNRHVLALRRPAVILRLPGKRGEGQGEARGGDR